MKNPTKLIGVDIGFGFAKGFDGQLPIIFPSILSHHGRPEEAAGPEQGAPGLGLHIEINGEGYFVGRRADCDWRSPQLPRQPDRLFGAYGKHLVLALLSAYTEMESPLHVVLGLPVSYFQLLKASCEAGLIGYHKLVWVEKDGSRIPKNIHIRKLHLVPHPMGTYSGLVMDANGRLQAEKFRERKIAVVDIGFRSTNVIAMDRMRFSNRYSGSIDLGISRGFERIERKLRDETGRSLTFDQLYQAVRMGHIRIEDQTYNIERVRREAFSLLAEQLADNIGHLLAAAWDLDNLLLTGGGSRELADYIGPLLPGEVSQIENEQDARLNNAQGQLRLARALWGASGFCENAG
ncbi:MAG: ParM/StbA family protein [Desulfobacterales bacterium]|nr:ParM/StbA family protein [Desulfobacterales bacterium]